MFRSVGHKTATRRLNMLSRNKFLVYFGNSSYFLENPANKNFGLNFLCIFLILNIFDCQLHSVNLVSEWMCNDQFSSISLKSQQRFWISVLVGLYFFFWKLDCQLLMKWLWFTISFESVCFCYMYICLKF